MKPRRVLVVAGLALSIADAAFFTSTIIFMISYIIASFAVIVGALG